MSDPVRVFIGSGEASVLERKTLMYSIGKHSRRHVDFFVYNGTHNAIEKNDEPPVLAPLSLRLKYRSFTEFSLYRYLIPQLCEHVGRAIYVDSDMLLLTDIGELFDTPMHGCDFLATPAYAEKEWGTSVMLLDCSRCRFDLEAIYDEIDAGAFTYSEFSRMNARFLEKHPYKIGPLDPNWNVFDRYDDKTKLIHYTDLGRQPWKYAGHPAGELWFQHFQEARAAGAITDEDIHMSVARAYVRHNILEGNNPGGRPSVLGGLRRVARRLVGR